MHDLPYLPRCISAPIVKMHEHVNECSWHKNKAIKDKPKFNHVKGKKTINREQGPKSIKRDQNRGITRETNEEKKQKT